MLTVLLSLSLLATTPLEIIDEPRPPRDAKKTEPLILRPTDRTLVQRGFVPFRDLKRNYACVVGTAALALGVDGPDRHTFQTALMCSVTPSYCNRARRTGFFSPRPPRPENTISSAASPGTSP